MGAITFSIDTNLLQLITEERSGDIFVETGTFKGDTVAIAKDYFNKIYSIELSDSYYAEAKERFINDDKITLIHGDAAENLKALAVELCDKKVIYWLDAHWCVADETAGITSQCNLCEELEGIGNLNAESVIIIDDARLFLCTPPQPHEISQWPTFQAILKNLLALSDKHHLTIINDNIIFYPQTMANTLKKFALNHGVDWLNFVDKSKHYDNLLAQLKEKDIAIKEKDLEITNLLNICKAREDLIIQTSNEVNRLNATLNYSFIRRMGKIIKSQLIKSQVYFKPYLGRLYQYSAKPIYINKSYKTSINLSSHPKISIVTPSYKQAQYIEKTINSVLDQKYPNLQYVIQDNNSRDGTEEILKQYQNQLAHWESVPDGGQSNAINLGFKHTDGEIMAYLNSDDLLLPGSLHYVVDYFLKNPEIDVIYGHRIIIDKNDFEVGRWVLPQHSNEALRWVDYIPQETLFWRRSIWEKSGGNIDEKFQFAMDWDLILRFIEAGAKFKCLPRFIGAFRVHDMQKTSAQINERGKQEMEILRERCNGRKVSRKEIHKNIRGYLIRHMVSQSFYKIGLLKY